MKSEKYIEMRIDEMEREMFIALKHVKSILSAKSKYVYNPISEEDQLAEKLKKKGKEIISLSAGDPAKYFETPKYFIDAYIRALKEGKTFYALGAGVKELRQAIANRYRRLYKLNADPEDVIVTQGVSEAIDFLNAIMINAPRGDSRFGK